MEGIHLPQDTGEWRALVATVMNLRVPWKADNLLPIWAISSFSRWALLYGVSYPISAWLCCGMASGRLLSSLLFWQQANTARTLPRVLLKWHAWYIHRVYMKSLGNPEVTQMQTEKGIWKHNS
jgi:hypothetical protein